MPSQETLDAINNIKSKTNNEEVIPEKQTKVTNPNEIKLGKNKIVHIKPWIGKTKKRIRKAFQFIDDPENIDFERIMDDLLYKHIIEGNNIFLNEGEQLYLLSKIKEISINDKIVDSEVCANCGVENDIKTTTKKSVHYKENTFPKEVGIINGHNILVQDIISLKDFKEELKILDDFNDETSEVDILFSMHIKATKDSRELSTKEKIKFLDELPLNEIDKIIESINECSPECEIFVEQECKNCGKKSKFNLDITKGIFEELMK